MTYPTLIPTINDEHYDDAKFLHDSLCGCPAGLTWGWYEFAKELINSGKTIREYVKEEMER